MPPGEDEPSDAAAGAGNVPGIERVDEVVIGRLLQLARTDRERRKASGWWNQYPQLPAMVEYVALEDIATSIRT